MNAPSLTLEMLKSEIVGEDYFIVPNTTTTICVLTCENGYVLTGTSACVSKENFDVEIGKKIAYDNAIKQLWGIKGYELRGRLHLMDKAAQLVKGEEIFKYGDVKTYIGQKVIYAVPMNRKEYNDLRKWELPVDENPNDEGYLVQNADGGNPNVEGFSGYVSWSPKEVFEKSYSLVAATEAKQPTTFLDRLFEESTALQDKLEKLDKYTGTKAFSELALIEQDALRLQRKLMTEYCDVLVGRISRLV